jgi:dTDP-4-dehydrorhamnose 3,5-epimerase
MTGVKDRQSVAQGGSRLDATSIDGVCVIGLHNVLTRTGAMLEVFRTDWPSVATSPRQVNWVQLAPGAVTDWHRHENQTDHIVAVEGNINLALWDDRPGSRTHGATQVVRMGIASPVMVIVPSGVFHALRNESGVAAGYLNVADQVYVAADPDNWRVRTGDKKFPDIL